MFSISPSEFCRHRICERLASIALVGAVLSFSSVRETTIERQEKRTVV